MINGQTLLATLERQQLGERRVSAWGILGNAALALIVIAVAGGMLAFTAYRLWLGWETGQWEGFWILTVSGAIFLVLPLLALAPLLIQQQGLAPAIPALRQIAAAREDTLTPLVVPQPPALLSEQALTDAIKIGPLRRLAPTASRRPLTRVPFVWLIFYLPLMVSFIGFNDIDLGPILTFSVGPFNLGSLFPFVMVGLILLIGCAMLGVFIARSLSATTLAVIADAEGVRWRAERLGAEQRIAWRDVRSFSRITSVLLGGAGAYGALNSGLGVIYLLDGPDASLLWSLAPTTKDSLYGASDHLCRLIASRTGLPLRDLTTVANDLAVARGNVQRLLMIRSFAVTTSTTTVATASPTLQALAQTPPPPPPPQRRWRRVAPVFIVSLIPLLLSAAIFGYGGYVQNYQHGYFASLPQRLHAEQPNYEDPLSVDIGTFPVNAVTKQVSAGAQYANGAYELIGDDSTQVNLAWTTNDGVVSDGAFEVTVSEHGTKGISTGEGVGLLFGADQSGNNFGVFQIHADSSWELDSYHNDASDPADSWNYVDGGNSSAIHQGIGATNTLLTIKRGKFYLLYVNNHLIETFYDLDVALPASGYVGVYLNNDAQTGDFTNFAIYPVQPPSSEWYV